MELFELCYLHKYLPPLKGGCARTISFRFLLDLFIFCQDCSCVYYGNLLFTSPPLFLCSQPISQNTITLAAPAAADADVLNSISIHCCNVRERDRYGGERIGGGADRFKTASTLFFFPFLEGHYHRAWCSSAHHDVAWISFSASGSSGDEYILTRSDRHTWSKYTRTAARSAATKVRVCLQSEAGL